MTVPAIKLSGVRDLGGGGQAAYALYHDFSGGAANQIISIADVYGAGNSHLDIVYPQDESFFILSPPRYVVGPSGIVGLFEEAGAGRFTSFRSTVGWTTSWTTVPRPQVHLVATAYFPSASPPIGTTLLASLPPPAPTYATYNANYGRDTGPALGVSRGGDRKLVLTEAGGNSVTMTKFTSLVTLPLDVFIRCELIVDHAAGTMRGLCFFNADGTVPDIDSGVVAANTGSTSAFVQFGLDGAAWDYESGGRIFMSKVGVLGAAPGPIPRGRFVPALNQARGIYQQKRTP